MQCRLPEPPRSPTAELPLPQLETLASWTDERLRCVPMRRRLHSALVSRSHPIPDNRSNKLRRTSLVGKLFRFCHGPPDGGRGVCRRSVYRPPAGLLDWRQRGPRAEAASAHKRDGWGVRWIDTDEVVFLFFGIGGFGTFSAKKNRNRRARCGSIFCFLKKKQESNGITAPSATRYGCHADSGAARESGLSLS